ncbi:hypothetical protein J6590_083468 [Homalodisca vitripennis]|nr:hypothetical protein J6590_083468 [Homalodisca vitripennis]
MPYGLIESSIPENVILANFSECVKVIEEDKSSEVINYQNNKIELCESANLDVNLELSESKTAQLMELLQKFKDRYIAWDNTEIGRTNAEREILKDQVEDMLKRGVIQPSYSDYASPVDLLNQEQEDALQTLKDKLTSSPILKHFNSTLPVELHPNISDQGVGATLMQIENNDSLPNSYGSRRLSDAEEYTTTEKECNSVRRQKERHDKAHDKVRFVEYEVGDLVMVWTPTRKQGKSDKLLHRWHGPYKVVAKLSDYCTDIDRGDRCPHKSAERQRMSKLCGDKDSSAEMQTVCRVGQEVQLLPGVQKLASFNSIHYNKSASYSVEEIDSSLHSEMGAAHVLSVEVNTCLVCYMLFTNLYKDETNFLLCPNNSTVLAPKDIKNVYEVEQGAPMIIYPYKRVLTDVVRSVPSHWGIGRSDSGWMKAEVFYEYIGNVFNQYLIQEKFTAMDRGKKSYFTDIEIDHVSSNERDNDSSSLFSSNGESEYLPSDSDTELSTDSDTEFVTTYGISTAQFGDTTLSQNRVYTWARE